jgi:ATPase subunit of ABC transporter with duplicated ATPase domains
MPSDSSVVFHDVGFRHDGSADPIFAGLSVHFPRGFTGVVGANGAGKTTLLRLATGALLPERGEVLSPGDVILCPQRTDTPPEGLDAFLDADDGEAWMLRGRLGVSAEGAARWSTLSHGERKRIQIAVALWRAPALLAIDEPTNHIDAEARDLLAHALRRHRGVGLLVSHDRALLDALCAQCLWLERPEASLVPGGYTAARSQREADRASAVRARHRARTERDRLAREVARRREQSSRSHRDRSKRGLAPKDHDARYRKNLARVTGKDGRAGRSLRQLQGRHRQLEARLEASRVEKVSELGIWLPGSRSRRGRLFHVEAGGLPLGAGRRLHLPELSMGADDRVAITGPNGTGKSTLVRALLERVVLPDEKLTVMPQEIEAARGAALLDEARRLDPERLGQVMAVVSRLGSRPGPLLESAEPSPGEVRKLLLALGMARAPHLVVMDEPTNHLDLPSIECLEAALVGCPCGLLLVSHDEDFLQRLGVRRWRIEGDGVGDSRLEVEM